jgi:SecD/SecF fusion protein
LSKYSSKLLKRRIFALFFQNLCNNTVQKMQGKGLIKTFLVLISLVSLLQLLFISRTNKIEKEAENFARELTRDLEESDQVIAFRNARAVYLDSMGSEKILRIPLLANYTYNDLKRQQLALGLDLKGGMSTVLQVDLKDLLTSLAGRNSKDKDFVAALEAAEQAQQSSPSDYVSLFVSEFRRIAPDKQLARIFQQSEVLGDITFDTPDGEIERMLREKANETVSLTYNRLVERIDKLGVIQPNISLDANRDLILVEMPGIDNPERARQYLQASAQLEFWETYRFTDSGLLSAFQEADKRLKAEQDRLKGVDVEEEEEISDENETDTDSLETLSLGEDTEDLFTEKGPLLSLLEINQGQLSQTVMGLADKNKRNAVSELLARPDIRNLFPRDIKFLWSYKAHQDYTSRLFTNQYELYAIRMSAGAEKAPLDGEVVTNASSTLDNITGEPQVSLLMDARGAREWAKLTQRAFDGDSQGNRREIAIVLDNEVVTTPSVNTGAITGGASVISGNFNIQETVDLANILQVGKLPAKTKIIQETTVGPSLGKQNIQKSLRSLIVGFSLVLFFMIFYYMGGGIVSIISLFLNLFFIFGALSSFGTVLTLPGIAGIVLTIGMAVDANVIIFERIREELREGKSLAASVADGFKNSYSAIIDANVTTILTAMVLAYFGLGPIKGFAVVLIIGVLSSLFTAVVVGRLIIETYIANGQRNLSFWNGMTQNAFANMKVDWIGKRKVAYMVSGTLLVLSLSSILFRGFDLGVDFTGGHSYMVQFTADQKVDSEQLRTGLAQYLEQPPVVKQVDLANTYNITTAYAIEDTGEEVFDRVSMKLHEGLVAMTGASVDYNTFKNNDAGNEFMHVTQYNKVGSSIAKDIKDSSYYAGTFALLLIFLYIFIRFSKWQYSLGAVAALFHDSIIVVGIFSLLKGLVPFSMEIDQAFIAALLTVIGYSINDTVVVFDRIREFLGIHTSKNKDEVYNLAINATFSRTIVTSLTTAFVVLVLFLFGGSSITGFAFAILIGVLIGTYSSIFVATPVTRDLLDRAGE